MKVRIGAVLGVYSDPHRDPRGHTVSVLYDAKPTGGTARGGDDASDARWFAPADLAGLDFAFDHARIVGEQLARRRRGRPASTGLRARRPGAHSRRARPGGARG